MKMVDKILAAGVPAEWLDRELNRRAGYHFERCGRLEDAAACYADAGDAGRAAELYLRIDAPQRAAPILMKQKRYGEALQIYRRWLEASEGQSPEHRAKAHLGVSACLTLMKKDPETARSMYASARKIVEDETGRSPLEVAKCWQALGEYGATLGRHDLLYIGFETALARYGKAHNRQRIDAAMNYLEMASNNRLLALDLANRIEEWLGEPDTLPPVLLLRSEPDIVGEEDALEAFGLRWAEPEETGFSFRMRRPSHYVENQFEDRGDTVFDRTTGLTWQKSGSDNWLNYNDAEKYVQDLNRDGFAGHSDWRLPTLLELASLLEPERNEHGYFLSPLFDQEKRWCWSSDRLSAGGGAWRVSFTNGYVDWDVPYNFVNYVRVCRS